ncbi:response regulator [Streptomyces sp. NPDC102365]|uniref:response regulator n=1 Tax=Streptomyces sp. NPDC102365 TaxID=3366162 RepID=UPI0038249647
MSHAESTSTESRPDPVRVVIVDDEELVRMALRLVIDGEPDLTVVGEAADGNAALTVVAEQRPDVVLMDVRMPGRDGLETTRELLARPAPPRVLMLTTFDSDDLVLGALRAGALGFVLKDTPPARILDAVRTVADGNPVLSPAATARVIAAATGPDSAHTRDRHRAAARERLSSLTERERETARAIADGLGNPQIAERLHISVATVKAHTGSLFAKLAVENRVQIALLIRDAED